jgi:hypothetical protein
VAPVGKAFPGVTVDDAILRSELGKYVLNNEVRSMPHYLFYAFKTLNCKQGMLANIIPLGTRREGTPDEDAHTLTAHQSRSQPLPILLIWEPYKVQRTRSFTPLYTFSPVYPRFKDRCGLGSACFGRQSWTPVGLRPNCYQLQKQNRIGQARGGPQSECKHNFKGSPGSQLRVRCTMSDPS